SNLLSKIKAIGIIAKCSGVLGMIGGQVVDMESQDKKISADLLKYMHERKTGALIKASVLAAAVLSNADQNQLNALKIYSEKIGLAFQIKDDILDVEGSFKDLGKCTGSDENNAKSTFVSVHGLEKSKSMLTEVSCHAQEKLRNFGESGAFLSCLTEFLVERNK
ncbi:MAG TPA: polyprenyl synthetase family protein, partial [Clostridia bacterium]|nr:polyprenyl synthetase family protein [Clostridia bacterium]